MSGSGSGSVSGGSNHVDWTKWAKNNRNENGSGWSEITPMSINVTVALIPTCLGGGGFRMGGLLHLPHRFPPSPSEQGGPEIEVCMPMGGQHGCCSIEVHKPAHFPPHRAPSLWLFPFSTGRVTLDANGSACGLRAVWDRRVLEGDGEKEGCLGVGPGIQSNPGALLSDDVYNISLVIGRKVK